jgi:dihydroorotate dehydrogenase electron transfer subunit
VEAVAPESVTQSTATVLLNEPMARDTYRLRLDAPAIAEAIVPGQFVMVRAGLDADPLLGRPFALYDVVSDSSGRPTAIDVVYLVVGRGTAALARCQPGDRLPVWGPLGNGFGPSTRGPVVFVAGGIGQTPFLSLGRWWLGQRRYGGRDAGPTRGSSATLLYGARTAAYVAGVDDFRAAGVEVELATDDGSAGHHGFVTDLLTRRIEQGDRPSRVVGCGPPAMLRALTRLVEGHGIRCDLSLENHMACGFGVCFSCVAPIRQPDGTADLRRVCVEGPVFESAHVVWDSGDR